ncbi:GNAT family N-acetyltransferase [Gordonia sp. VNK21]|uniref:GNAT family N-acetyltransferase n=1 Tax=Gordonia sp. VNK21 TaxID=3382483 RepID=UPI0038D456BA
MSSQSPNLNLRPARDEDWPEIGELDARAFTLPAPLPADELAEFRSSAPDADTLTVRDEDSPGRPLVAFSLFHRLPLTVPGGAIPTVAGLSWVSVAATHRRRGLLRTMMAEHFRSWERDGLPLAALTASEGGIYERFGFGPACYAHDVRIDPSSAQLRDAAPADSRVRYGTLDQARVHVPEVHRRWAADRPGAVGRPDGWWASLFADRDFRRSPQVSGVYFLLHADGYAAYRIDSRDSTALIEGFFAATEQAHTDLWRVLTGLDLVSGISASLPLDDTLPLKLVNARAVRVTGRPDKLWLSVLDVAAALELRRYDTDGAVLLEVSDFWAGRTGDYLLEVGDGRGRVTRDAAEPPGVPRIRLDISVLSSLYLGGGTARDFAAAGRLQADDDAAVELVTALLAGRRAPFAGTFF